jgi:hypothetical protein
MRSLRIVLVLAPFLALVLQALLPGKASPLPLFARKYSMQCTQCHVAFPKLNAFGMKFRQNGYRLEGAKGESPWESGSFPLSLVGNVGYDHISTDTADVVTGARGSSATSQFVQHAVEFHTAGTLAENVTFHFDNGFADGAGGVLESGMAFVQFDDLGKDGAANLKVGIYDAEIPYLADSRKLTLHEYLSPVTLDGQGLELNGAKSGWTYAAGLINSGRDPANAKPGSKTFNRLENYYVWLMRDLQGQYVTARFFSDRQDPRTVDATSSQHLQAEINAQLTNGRWFLIPGYTYESFDDQPAPGIKDKHQTGLIEAIVLLDKGQRWEVTGRAEITDIAKNDVAPVIDQQLQVVNLSYFVNPNAKVALEWAHDADNVQGPRITQLNAYVHVGY